MPKQPVESTVQKQTSSKSSSHPVNLPVPPLNSRYEKPTRLEIAREELKKELNKPSNQVNIKRVKELHEKIGRLEDLWRGKSRGQKRARRGKQSICKKVQQKSGKTTGYLDSFRHPIALTPKRLFESHAILKSVKFTRLQIICRELDKELSKPSVSVNVERVKELERKKERLEQEWHNRSRAQKQVWRWRKKVAEMVKEKDTKDMVQSAEVSGQPESPALDEETCTRCPVRCPSVESVRGHWKGKLSDFLSDILRRVGGEKGSKNPESGSARGICEFEDSIKKFLKIPFILKIVEWIYRRFVLQYLLKGIKDICTKVK
jgi:hypothetical protein